MHALGPDQAGLGAVAQAGEVFLFSLEGSELCRRIGQFAEAPAQVAGNRVLLDAASDQCHRLDAGLLQVAHAILANVAGKAADIMADAANQLAAVAPAGAPADATALQQHHAKPALSQFQRGVDPGQPAADYAHVSRQFAVEAGVGRRVARRGGVVRRGMLGIERHDAFSVQRLDLILLQERVMTRMIFGLGVLEMYSLSSTSWGG